MRRMPARSHRQYEPTSIFQLQKAPADGIRLPYSTTETSVRRRFWAALGQGKLSDRASTYRFCGLTPSLFDAFVGRLGRPSNRGSGVTQFQVISRERDDRPLLIGTGPAWPSAPFHFFDDN